MSDTIKKGDKVRIFLDDGFNFSGIVLALADDSIKLFDEKTNFPAVLYKAKIKNIIVLEEAKKDKGSDDSVKS